MKIIIRKATIISPGTSYHRQSLDILIHNGIISEISEQITSATDQEIQLENLHVSVGWMDPFSMLGEPGFEYRETLLSGSEAAAAGGFTDIAVLPNTSPVLDNKSVLTYIKKVPNCKASLHPLGAVSINTEGKVLSEMYDLRESGAIGFTDGLNSIQHGGLLLKALQYVLPFDGVIIQLPNDLTISAHTLMNEGIVSTQLGLPGSPAIAEEMMIQRDIELIRYTGSRLHVTGISTARGLQQIIQAKNEGLNITCSVTPYHLHFCDEHLRSYDTCLKVNPPLRTFEDRDALRNALKDGHIDGIASHHIPRHIDEKNCEFEYAKSGMITLQQVWQIASLYCSTDRLINILTVNNRNIFNLTVPAISCGNTACLTLFNPDKLNTFSASVNRSLSTNSPFIDKELKGVVYGTIREKQLNLFQ